MASLAARRGVNKRQSIRQWTRVACLLVDAQTRSPSHWSVGTCGQFKCRIIPTKTPVAAGGVLWPAFVSRSSSKMRAWILCALVIVALVACFQLAEAKPAVTIDRAPHDLEVGGGGDKEIEGRPRRHRRKKGGKHGQNRGKLNPRRPKPRRRRFKKPRSVEDDRRRVKKCENGKRGKNCKRQ